MSLKSITADLKHLDEARHAARSIGRSVSKICTFPDFDYILLQFYYQQTNADDLPPKGKTANTKSSFRLPPTGIIAGALLLLLIQTFFLLTDLLLFSVLMPVVAGCLIYILRKNWLLTRLQILSERRHFNNHLSVIAHSVKYLDALEIDYPRTELKVKLYEALISKKDISGTDVLTLYTLIHRSFVDNDDLSDHEKTAFDDTFIPENYSNHKEYSVLHDASIGDGEYLQNIEVETIEPHTQIIESNFKEIFSRQPHIDQTPDKSPTGTQYEETDHEEATPSQTETSEGTGETCNAQKDTDQRREMSDSEQLRTDNIEEEQSVHQSNSTPIPPSDDAKSYQESNLMDELTSNNGLNISKVTESNHAAETNNDNALYEELIHAAEDEDNK
ncbi:hypothetical protein AB4254_08915 [Vibrio breoganii]